MIPKFLVKDEVLMCIGDVHPLDHNMQAVLNKINRLREVEIIQCERCKYNPRNYRSYADNDPIETYSHCFHMKDSDFCSLAKEEELES